MFKLIISKELRDIITSKKFIFAFTTCSVLIILSFYIGARSFQLSQRQYEAAISENFRQMEGITDWLMVKHHIFLEPHPLNSLVNGISSDIGRNIEMYGLGELKAHDSRFNEDPIYAIFRFIDLNFIFQIVLSLFAILMAYNMINGEKESGTLKLIFSNSIPKDKYILGKIVSSFLAIALPLLIPLLFGSLLLIIMGIPMNSDDWLKLLIICISGFLYFGVFLTFSLFLSACTYRSSSSFMLSLVIWIFFVLIIPRGSVLIAGRAVEVPSVDEIASKKFRYRSQLWTEDVQKMNGFTAPTGADTQEMASTFHKFMGQLSEERNDKLNVFYTKLNEDRLNRQNIQAEVALNLSRVSPASAFSLSTMNLAGTSLKLKQEYREQANNYQQIYKQFISQKTDGMIPGAGMVMIKLNENGEEPETINPHEIPEFKFLKPSFNEVLHASIIDLTILIIFNLIFFGAAVFRFLKYDVR